MTNIGSESIHFVFIFSAPGFEEYMRAESVREGERNTALILRQQGCRDAQFRDFRSLVTGRENRFGQIRTVKLRNSARRPQSGNPHRTGPVKGMMFAVRFEPLDPFHAHARARLFSRLFLRSGDFLLQNCAIPRNAAQTGLVRFTYEKHAMQCGANVRKTR